MLAMVDFERQLVISGARPATKGNQKGGDRIGVLDGNSTIDQGPDRRQDMPAAVRVARRV